MIRVRILASTLAGITGIGAIAWMFGDERRGNHTALGKVDDLPAVKLTRIEAPSSSSDAPSVAQAISPSHPPAPDAARADIPFASEAHVRLLGARSNRGDLSTGVNTLSDLHARLLAEPRKHDWAARAESLVRQFFEASGLHTIEARYITCRSTLCEVQALAHAPSEADYDAVMVAMRGYDWSAVGLSVGTASADVGPESDDEHIIIFLQRHSQP